MIQCKPVGMLMFDQEGKLLFGRRSDNKGWCFPGGKADAGESSLDASIRETQEETKIEVPREKVEKLGDCITFDNDDGVNMHKMSSIFYLTIPVENSEPRITNELIEFRWLYPEEAIEALRLFTPTKQALTFFKPDIANISNFLRTRER